MFNKLGKLKLGQTMNRSTILRQMKYSQHDNYKTKLPKEDSPTYLPKAIYFRKFTDKSEKENLPAQQ